MRPFSLLFVAVLVGSLKSNYGSTVPTISTRVTPNFVTSDLGIVL